MAILKHMLIALLLLSLPANVSAGENNSEDLRALFQEVRKLRVENRALRERLDRLEGRGAANPLAGPISIPPLPERVEFCGEEVPLGMWDVRERLEREYYMILSDPGRVVLWIKRAARYFPIIEKELKERGLPDDLKYLAIIESELNPRAYSSAGAAGYWQFIRSTGRKYDLRINRSVDERRDFLKSTSSALRYLSDLYKIFNDWPLAMASYNAGEERVKGELKRQGVESYYQLRLPLETERYVFRAIAAAIILSDPGRLGYRPDADPPYGPLEYDEVEVRVGRNGMHLRTVALYSGSHYREIKELNPQLKLDYLPRGTHLIKVPKGAGSRFMANYRRAFEKDRKLASGTAVVSPDGRSMTYKVKRGDTLWEIADRYGVNVASLRKWNGLKKGRHIYPGDLLRIRRD